MSTKRVILRSGQGAFGLALFVVLLLIFVVWRLPVATLIAVALPYMEAGSGLKYDYQSLEPKVAGARFEGFSISGKEQRWLSFSELAVGSNMWGLLAGRPGVNIHGQIAGGGELGAQVQFRFGDLDLSVHTRQFPLSPLNGLLHRWGAEVTSTVKLDLEARFPLSAPHQITGNIALELQPVEIYGGPMVAGFGLGRIAIAKIRGAQAIKAGTIENLDLLVDGDDIWGHLRLSVRLRQPFGASSYSFIPELKFRDDIAAKLVPVLPMAGLATNGKGYYTRTFSGSFAKL